MAGTSGASIDHYSTILPGDLVWVWNISSSNTYRAIKIGNSNETIPILLPSDYPIMDSLMSKSSGNPGADTNEFIVGVFNWTGARNMRIDIDGVLVTIGSITPSGNNKMQKISYTILQANWNTIYLGAPTSISAQVQVEINSVWTPIYNLDVPV